MLASVFRQSAAQARDQAASQARQEAAALADPSTGPEPLDPSQILSALMDGAAVMIGVVQALDGDLLHLIANPAAAVFFGGEHVGPSGIAGKTMAELGVPGAVIKNWAKHCAHSERAARPARFEYLHPGPAGPRRLAITLSATPGEIASNSPRFCYLAEDVTQRRRIESELRELQAAVDSAADGVARIDADGKLVWVNRAYAVLLRSSPADLAASDWLAAIHPEDRVAACDLYRRMLDSGRAEGECRALRKDATSFACHLVMAESRDRRSRFDGHFAYLRDISENAGQRIKTAAALRESQERYALAVRGANDGIWDWDLKTDKLYFSPRWKAMVGCADAEIGDSPDEWYDRIHPEDLARVEAEIAAHRAGRSADLHVEHRLLHRAAGWRWVLARGLAVRDGAGIAYRMAGSLTDITARKEAEDRLEHAALHDGLTGLANRIYFTECLRRALARAQRDDGHLLAVLMIDLDGFKQINDTRGHAAGDELLVNVAKTLTRHVREGDLVARLGGDEFVIMLDDMKLPAEADDIVARIRSALSDVKASIGVALFNESYRTPDELLHAADAAMYAQKSRHKSR